MAVSGKRFFPTLICLLFGWAWLGVVLAADDALKIENELLLDLRLDGERLGLDILGYQRGDEFLISLEELVSGLGFPITVDATQGIANGWFIAPERTFALNVRRSEVLISGKALPPTGKQAVMFEGGIYVEAGALQQWFPVRLSAQIRELYLDVEPTETLPIQERLARRKRVGRGEPDRQEAQLPLQESPYQLVGPHSTRVRVGYSTLRRTPDSDAEYKGNYALLSRGDLAWMTSTLSLSGDSDDSLAGAALTLERTEFDGPLALNHVELGDVSNGGSRGVLVRGGGVRRALGGRFADESVNLQGNLLPDWDVELYQNGQFIETKTTGADGRYLFQNVPLLFGENRFELKLYGPNGETQTREEFHYLGAEMLRPGRVSYELAVMQNGRSVFDVNEISGTGDRDSGYYTADFNVGLSRNLTAGAGVSSVVKQGERLNYTNAGFGLASSFVYASVRAYQAPDAQDSLSTSLRSSIGSSSLNLSYTEYKDEPDLASSALQWRGSLGLRSSLLGASVNLDLTAEEQDTLSRRRVALGTTIPMQSGGRLSTSVWGEQTQEFTASDPVVTRESAGQTSFYTTVSPWTFRVGGSYRLQPVTEIIDYSAKSSLRVARDLTLNLDVRQSETTNVTTYQGGINWIMDEALLSARVSYDSDERWTGLITLTTTLVPQRDRWIPRVDSRASVNSGTVEAQVFSGVEGDDAEPIEGVTAHAVQAWRKASTDLSGTAYLQNLPAHNQVDIEIDEGTIGDNELNSASAGVSVIPRPGSYHVVKFPLIRTAELEGHVWMQDGKDLQAVSRALVQLMTLDGEIIEQRRSAFDGFFLFDGIAPGRYHITLAGGLAERVQKRPVTIEVRRRGGIIRNLDFVLGAEPEKSLIQTLPIEKSNGQATPSRRGFAPAQPEPDPARPWIASDDVIDLQGQPLESTSRPIAQPLGAGNSGASGDLTAAGSSNTANASIPVPIAMQTNAAPPTDPAPPEPQWFVQLGVYGTAARAQTYWDELKPRVIALRNQDFRLQNVRDLVRLLVGPAATRAESEALCDRLKAQDIECLVRRGS